MTGGMFALSGLGFYMMGEKPRLEPADIAALDQNDVWSFDRKAFSQSYPARESVYTISDIGLWGSSLAPALLFFDPKIREDWLDITIMYFETQAINLNVYVWGGPVFTSRVRPLVYIEEEPDDFKLGPSAQDSFFSGHTSMTAGASFFMAKVISDYHPELGSKKWLLYSAALVPPAIVGYCRYRGFKHFPTDILIGTAVGAVVGVAVPQLHKITSKMNENLSIIPFTGTFSGVAISIRLE